MGVFMERFKNGDRVCFIGDSLIAMNHTLPWIIDSYRNNFPNEDIRFFNCGVAGGTAEFALEIFEEDVLPWKPTHAVVAFGANDSWHWCLDEPKGEARYKTLKERFEIFKACIEKLCDKILQNNIKLILCTPAPYDEYTESPAPTYKGGYALLSEYANFVRYFAKAKGYTFCDYYEALVELMQTDMIFSSDRVHPTPHGFYRMANVFLSKQNVGISEESDVTLKFPEWWEAVKIYREIFTAECMVLNKPGLSIAEKLEMARDYIEKNKDNPNPEYDGWFLSLCDNYLQNRENVPKLCKNIEELYIKEILKG